MSAKPVLILANPRLVQMIDLLAGQFEILPLWEDAAKAHLPTCRVLITGGGFMVTRDVIDAMPKLELIACFSVGYDGIDIPYARSKGIEVTHSPGANGDDVADHALGMIIGLRRWIVSGDREIRQGGWVQGPRPRSKSLAGARLGIVGLGGIGICMARRGDLMRMPVRWWGPRPKPDAQWERAESLLDLARWCDIMVLCAPSGPANEGMVSKEIIEAIGPDGMLVNVARGQLVDEDALIAALKDGRLGSAGLDVFLEEPTPRDRWTDVPNTVLTPHTAGATDVAAATMLDMMHQNILAFLAGKPVLNPVPR